MEKAQCGSESNVVHRGATAAAGRPGKQRKRKGGEPIKVVYVNNPMRVTTDAAGFRVLVQELTGRHADPSKYGAVSGESSGSPAGPRMAPSPSITVESSEGASAGAGTCHGDFPPTPAAAAAYGYGDGDGEDSFAQQLIDNRYSVFSPPTFLYASHDEM